MGYQFYDADANIQCTRCGNTLIVRDGKGRESSLYCFKCGYRLYYYTVVREMEKRGIKIITCLNCNIDFVASNKGAFYCPNCNSADLREEDND